MFGSHAPIFKVLSFIFALHFDNIFRVVTVKKNNTDQKWCSRAGGRLCVTPSGAIKDFLNRLKRGSVTFPLNLICEGDLEIHRLLLLGQQLSPKLSQIWRFWLPSQTFFTNSCKAPQCMQKVTVKLRQEDNITDTQAEMRSRGTAVQHGDCPWKLELVVSHNLPRHSNSYKPLNSRPPRLAPICLERSRSCRPRQNK